MSQEISSNAPIIAEILREVELGTLGQHTPAATARTLAKTAEWRQRAELEPSMASRVPLGSAEEVAEYLGGIPVKTLAQWRYKGGGPKYVKVGKYVRYRWSDVDAWLASQERAVQTA